MTKWKEPTQEIPLRLPQLSQTKKIDLNNIICSSIDKNIIPSNEFLQIWHHGPLKKTPINP